MSASQDSIEEQDADALKMSDLEFSMIVAFNGFMRWVVRCAEATGARNLGPLDILVLHAVNHRARNKKLSDICLVMNIEDSHTVGYALKKLEERGLVAHTQSGRDRTYRSSQSGDELCAQYRTVRRASLIALLREDGVDFSEIEHLVTRMNRIARHYSDAERKATILSAEKAG